MDLAPGLAPGLLPGLVAGVVALGIAGLAHCAAMCGLPCAVVLARRSALDTAGFLAARVGSYSLAGAVLGAGIGQLAEASAVSRALQPLWTLWHVIGLAWGLWMLAKAQQPAWLERWLPSPQRLQGASRPVVWATAGAGPPLMPNAPSRRHGGAWAWLAGLLWVAWPCGLLHSALLMSSLAGGASAGAALMLLFALITSLGLLAAPALWRRMGSAAATMWATRCAGALLVAGCLWALVARTGLVDWCLSHFG